MGITYFDALSCGGASVAIGRYRSLSVAIGRYRSLSVASSRSVFLLYLRGSSASVTGSSRYPAEHPWYSFDYGRG
ncbi:hypothetical protein, partial [Adlercreutzia sp.]|uniref:hypothetical protein n=1 Tax=Adlercreutzia sp. TaxID=1872387 RepID=UPI003A880EE5